MIHLLVTCQLRLYVAAVGKQVSWMSTIMIADNENVICSYKSYQGPSLPPRSWWITSFYFTRGKKAAEKKNLQGKGIACDPSVGGTGCQSMKSQCQTKLRRDRNVTLPGNFQSCSISRGLFCIVFWNIWCFPPPHLITTPDLLYVCYPHIEMVHLAEFWDGVWGSGGWGLGAEWMMNHVRSTQGWESDAIDHLHSARTVHLMRKSVWSRDGDSSMSLWVAVNPFQIQAFGKQSIAV